MRPIAARNSKGVNMTKEKKEQKAVAIKKEDSKNKLMFAGGAKLLEKSTNKEVQKERNYILVAAGVLGVSPFGITILGGVPYLNKLGRKEKLSKYGNNKWSVKYQWIQRALSDTDKAICEAAIIDESGKQLSDWITGESSPASMKMGTLAGYQNHLAQTRAHNRAIEEYLGMQIHQEMLENVARLKKDGQKDVPLINTTVSAEEMESQSNHKEQPSQELKVEFECHECANPITKAEVEFSKKMFKKPLCRDCQKARKENK